MNKRPLSKLNNFQYYPMPVEKNFSVVRKIRHKQSISLCAIEKNASKFTKSICSTKLFNGTRLKAKDFSVGSINQDQSPRSIILKHPFESLLVKSLNQLDQDKNQSFFFNQTFSKSKLNRLIYWSFSKYGQNSTVDLVEKLKTIGYSYATLAGISLSIDDLQIPVSKNQLVARAEQQLDFTNQNFEKGHLTSIESFGRILNTWNKTSERIKDQVIVDFKTTDVLNPVFIMAFSGARGNISQVRQLVGMRGLMSDPQGRIIDFPIQSNFREGLTLTEYIISCYGARKGVVDTALRTATSGYLTRRLVDVAQHVLVRRFDCLSTAGIDLKAIQSGTSTVLTLKQRIIGRVLAKTIVSKTNMIVLMRNTTISPRDASQIVLHTDTVCVRSPLTCSVRQGYICQLCYGWSLAYSQLVPLGEAVGIIAAQSIGEPGTQLTMRTFHTGGVFSGTVSDEIRAPFQGHVFYSDQIPGKLVRTAYGQIALLTKQDSCLTVIPLKTKGSIDSPEAIQFNIAAYSLLFSKQNQLVEKEQVLAEASFASTDKISSVESFETIYSDFPGEIRLSLPSLPTLVLNLDGNKVVNKRMVLSSNEFWILSAQNSYVYKPIEPLAFHGDFIHKSATSYLYNTEINSLSPKDRNLASNLIEPNDPEKSFIDFYDFGLTRHQKLNYSKNLAPEPNSIGLKNNGYFTILAPDFFQVSLNNFGTRKKQNDFKIKKQDTSKANSISLPCLWSKGVLFYNQKTLDLETVLPQNHFSLENKSQSDQFDLETMLFLPDYKTVNFGEGLKRVFNIDFETNHFIKPPIAKKNSVTWSSFLRQYSFSNNNFYFRWLTSCSNGSVVPNFKGNNLSKLTYDFAQFALVGLTVKRPERELKYDQPANKLMQSLVNGNYLHPCIGNQFFYFMCSELKQPSLEKAKLCKWKSPDTDELNCFQVKKVLTIGSFCRHANHMAIRKSHDNNVTTTIFSSLKSLSEKMVHFQWENDFESAKTASNFTIDSCKRFSLFTQKKPGLIVINDESSKVLAALFEHIIYLSKQKAFTHVLNVPEKCKTSLQTKKISTKDYYRRFLNQQNFLWQSPLYGVHLAHNALNDLWKHKMAKQNQITWFEKQDCQTNNLKLNDSHFSPKMDQLKVISFPFKLKLALGVITNIEFVQKDTNSLVKNNSFRLSKLCAQFQLILNHASLFVKVEQLKTAYPATTKATAQPKIGTTFTSPFLEKTYLFGSDNKFADVYFDNNFIFKTNLAILTVPGVSGASNFHLCSKSNLIFKAIFAKHLTLNSKIKKSTVKLHLSLIEQISHWDFNVNVLNKKMAINCFSKLQLKWRDQYKSTTLTRLYHSTNFSPMLSQWHQMTYQSQIPFKQENYLIHSQFSKRLVQTSSILNANIGNLIQLKLVSVWDEHKVIASSAQGFNAKWAQIEPCLLTWFDYQFEVVNLFCPVHRELNNVASLNNQFLTDLSATSLMSAASFNYEQNGAPRDIKFQFQKMGWFSAVGLRSKDLYTNLKLNFKCHRKKTDISFEYGTILTRFMTPNYGNFIKRKTTIYTSKLIGHSFVWENQHKLFPKSGLQYKLFEASSFVSNLTRLKNQLICFNQKAVANKQLSLFIAYPSLFVKTDLKLAESVTALTRHLHLKHESFNQKSFGILKNPLLVPTDGDYQWKKFEILRFALKFYATKFKILTRNLDYSAKNNFNVKSFNIKKNVFFKVFQASLNSNNQDQVNLLSLVYENSKVILNYLKITHLKTFKCPSIQIIPCHSVKTKSNVSVYNSYVDLNLTDIVNTSNENNQRIVLFTLTTTHFSFTTRYEPKLLTFTTDKRLHCDKKYSNLNSDTLQINLENVSKPKILGLQSKTNRIYTECTFVNSANASYNSEFQFDLETAVVFLITQKSNDYFILDLLNKTDLANYLAMKIRLTAVTLQAHFLEQGPLPKEEIVSFSSPKPTVNRNLRNLILQKNCLNQIEIKQTGSNFLNRSLTNDLSPVNWSMQSSSCENVPQRAQLSFVDQELNLNFDSKTRISKAIYLKRLLSKIIHFDITKMNNSCILNTRNKSRKVTDFTETGLRFYNGASKSTAFKWNKFEVENNKTTKLGRSVLSTLTQTGLQSSSDRPFFGSNFRSIVCFTWNKFSSDINLYHLTKLYLNNRFKKISLVHHDLRSQSELIQWHKMHLLQISLNTKLNLPNSSLVQNHVKKTGQVLLQRSEKKHNLHFNQFELCPFTGEVIRSTICCNDLSSDFEGNKKKKPAEMQVLTNLDLFTWDLSAYKNKHYQIRLGTVVRYGTEIIHGVGSAQSGQVILMTNNKLVLRRAKPFLVPGGSLCNVSNGDWVAFQTPLLTVSYKTLQNDDIVQGIPKIEQLFEARENVHNGESLNRRLKNKLHSYKKSMSRKDAVRKSVKYIQQYIIDGIQYVYQSQGVNISDKHVEIIVKQMTSKVKITNARGTLFFTGDIVDLCAAEAVNAFSHVSFTSRYEPIVLGITKASLDTESFLSAASFQETIKVLSHAAFFHKRDFLRGLKENVILGHLLPVGTGFESHFQSSCFNRPLKLKMAISYDLGPERLQKKNTELD